MRLTEERRIGFEDGPCVKKAQGSAPYFASSFSDLNLCISFSEPFFVFSFLELFEEKRSPRGHSAKACWHKAVPVCWSPVGETRAAPCIRHGANLFLVTSHARVVGWSDVACLLSFHTIDYTSDHLDSTRLVSAA